MAAKKKSRHATSDGYAYLTKRTMVTKARAAGIRAAEKAMKVMGHVVVEENGRIIKKYADGHIEEVSLIH